MKTKTKRTVTAVVIMAVIAAVVAGYKIKSSLGDGVAEFPMYTVASGPLDITVTTPGTIQSRQSQIVRSKAQGRNAIIWIIDEGKVVTNGQVLIELDSSDLEKQLTDQQIVVGNSEASLLQAREKLAIAQIEKESTISQAELKLMLSKLEREKYIEGEYPQQLQDADSKIALAREELERATEQLNWTRKLAEEGFVTRSDLQSDELSLQQKKLSLDSAIVSMNLLTNYTARQQHAKLDSDIDQAERDLDRATRQARANLSQAETELGAKEQENERQKLKLSTLEEQVQNCKITAPTNGLVIYASTMQASRRHWGSDPLATGSYVFERQELIYIPVEGGMIVEFTVPESDLNKLTNDIPATVKVDALPDAVINGKLTKIGLLPDGRNAWLNPDLKVYNCEVSITPGDDAKLRAGMNCEVSMLVESYKDVIAVPLQCVLRVKGRPSVFMLENGEPVPHPVKLGYDNGRMIHIIEGLAAGDKIMLTPPLSAAEKAQEETAENEETDIEPKEKPSNE